MGRESKTRKLLGLGSGPSLLGGILGQGSFFLSLGIGSGDV